MKIIISKKCAPIVRSNMPIRQIYACNKEKVCCIVFMYLFLASRILSFEHILRVLRFSLELDSLAWKRPKAALVLAGRSGRFERDRPANYRVTVLCDPCPLGDPKRPAHTPSLYSMDGSVLSEMQTHLYKRWPTHRVKVVRCTRSTRCCASAPVHLANRQLS